MLVIFPNGNQERLLSGNYQFLYLYTSNITPTPSTITLKKGPIATSSGSFVNQSFVYSILEDITVPVSDGEANFRIYQSYEGNPL